MAPVSGSSLDLLVAVLLALSATFFLSPAHGRQAPASAPSPLPRLDGSLTYLWPLPTQFRHGNATISVDPDIAFYLQGAGGNSVILGEALERYRAVIFGHRARLSRRRSFDLRKLTVFVASGDETLQLGVDESYTLTIAQADDQSIIAESTLEV